MKRVLIICNTYYQLIIGIQIRKKIMVSDYVDVIITDHSRNAMQIAKNLRSLNLFNNVIYACTKEICGIPKTKLRIIKDVIHGVWGDKSIFFSKEDKLYYDELLYYNPDLATHFLYAALYKQNHKIVISRFEEGIMSYNTTFQQYKKLEIIYKIRYLLKEKNLKDQTSFFYCINSEKYNGNEEVINIPRFQTNNIDNSEIAKVFNLETDKLRYDEKYIFFSSVYDFEGEHSIGEIEFAKKVAEYVGYDNLLIKVHPRDNPKRFIDMGLKVDTNSMIPWEAIQLNYDFSKSIFITVASTSVLTVSSVVENPPKTFFAHQLFKRNINSIFDKAAKFCDELFDSDDKLDNVWILKSLDELH